MEIKGKIIVALPAQGGVSKAGKEWSRQDYVIETQEKYPKKIAFSVMNDNIMNFELTIGQEVDIHVDINATEWNGKWYNSITCWKATVYNSGQQAAPSQPNYATKPPQQSASPQPTQQQMFGNDNKDDLPF